MFISDINCTAARNYLLPEPEAKTQQLYLLVCTHACKSLCHHMNLSLTVICSWGKIFRETSHHYRKWEQVFQLIFSIFTTTVCLAYSQAVFRWGRQTTELFSSNIAPEMSMGSTCTLLLCVSAAFLSMTWFQHLLVIVETVMLCQKLPLKRSQRIFFLLVT